MNGMNSTCGHFTDGGREFCVTKQDTTLPYVNYMWNQGFLSGVSQHMAGIGCFTGRPMQSVGEAHRNLMIREENRHFYVRDEDSGDCWSPGGYPCRTDFSDFSCRHGLGYSLLSSCHAGITVELRMFVPPSDAAEVWTVWVRNRSAIPRRIQVFPFADWLLAGYEEYCDVHSALRSEHSPDGRILLAINEAPERPYSTLHGMTRQIAYNGFLASSRVPEGYDMSRKAFLGMGQVDRPDALAEGHCRNSGGTCERLVGVQEHRLVLQPGASGSFHVLMGEAASLEEARALCERLFGRPGKGQPVSEYPNSGLSVAGTPMGGQPTAERHNGEQPTAERHNGEQPDAGMPMGRTSASPQVLCAEAGAAQPADEVERLFSSLCMEARRGEETFRIHTPEPRLDALFNHWIPQAVRLHGEVGTDTGKGFRDIMQAAWAATSFDAPGARDKIVQCLRHQFSDGHTLRGWNPMDAHHYSDGPVWMAPAVHAYLLETRDFMFLEQTIPWFDGGSASLWQHVLIGIRASTEDVGRHGLIRIRDGDWNDSLDMMGRAGRGESVWTSLAMVHALRCAEAMLLLPVPVPDREAFHAELVARRAKLVDAIDRFGWDGDRYLQGYDDEGEKVGAASNPEGSLYLNPQTWAILAGVVPEERLDAVLAAIDGPLESPYGSLVLTPPYRTPHPRIGRLSWFVPGMWENGSAYCHGTAFKIMADARLGRAEAAYRSLLRILPDSPENPSAHSGCPPYMLTNMYYGPDHPRCGQILYTWITGTADWLLKTMEGHLMGVRAEADGLRVDPCVPACWNRFSLRRVFLGARYDFTFENPEGRNRGVRSLSLDGRDVEGTLLPFPREGAHHCVRVLL